jgi:hypothetical protein
MTPFFFAILRHDIFSSFSPRRRQTRHLHFHFLRFHLGFHMIADTLPDTIDFRQARR